MQVTEAKTYLPLEKVLTKATNQARSNPDFEKLAEYLILRGLNENKEQLGIKGIAKYNMERNKKTEYQSKGWYSSDLLANIVTEKDITPAEMLETIKPIMMELQEEYPLIKKFLVKDDVLHLWEAQQYLLFHLTLARRRSK